MKTVIVHSYLIITNELTNVGKLIVSIDFIISFVFVATAMLKYFKLQFY